MKKIHKPLLFCILSAGISNAVAQQKYAILIGINDYYQKPGMVYNEHRLRGCVNDAKAMQAMLTGRLGFANTHITTLLNEEASSRKVAESMTRALEQCKPGDAFLLFFSGHGVYMNNAGQPLEDREIKHGRNQAMVLSDLYADNLDCLLTDAKLKTFINSLIDKKVTVTAIFDCCFSGLLTRETFSEGYNHYKSQDTDPDFPKSFPMIEQLIQVQDRYLDEKQSTATTAAAMEAIHKAYFFAPSIDINDARVIPRPDERPGSGFLSIAASTDEQKGADIMDETGAYHGVLTKALLTIYKNNPSDIPVSSMLAQITALVTVQQYKQTPTFFYDKQRLAGNLTGIAPSGFQNAVSVKCMGIEKSGNIWLEAGVLNGLAQGNKLSAPGGPVIQIERINYTKARAKMYNGNISQVRAGQIFTLTDPYTVSVPEAATIKIHIASRLFSDKEFGAFFQKTILPLTALPNYTDYKHWYSMRKTYNLFFPSPSAAAPSNNNYQGYPFLVFLPLPDYITGPLKQLLQKNQQVTLVETAAEADFSLCLNYAKERNGNAARFVFTYIPFGKNALNEPGYQFPEARAEVPNLPLSSTEAGNVVTSLNSMITGLIRSMGITQWLNTYPRQ